MTTTLTGPDPSRLPRLQQWCLAESKRDKRPEVAYKIFVYDVDGEHLDYYAAQCFDGHDDVPRMLASTNPVLIETYRNGRLTPAP